jgi:hypothetical protein
MVARMHEPRTSTVPGRSTTSIVLLSCAVLLTLDVSPQAQPRGGVPSFKVDPSWPLELPNNWILGAVTGVFVDAKGHVWVTHLPETLTEEETSIVQKPPIATCCAPAPPVIEFDAQGKVVQGWGQGSMDDTSNWPRNPHGIFVDHNDFVWIGTYMHHRVMKFTRDGKLVMTIGEYDKKSDLEVVGEFGHGGRQVGQMLRPHGMSVDAQGNLYVGEASTGRRVQKFTVSMR